MGNPNITIQEGIFIRNPEDYYILLGKAYRKVRGNGEYGCSGCAFCDSLCVCRSPHPTLAGCCLAQDGYVWERCVEELPDEFVDDVNDYWAERRSLLERETGTSVDSDTFDARRVSDGV